MNENELKKEASLQFFRATMAKKWFTLSFYVDENDVLRIGETSSDFPKNRFHECIALIGETIEKKINPVTWQPLPLAPHLVEEEGRNENLV